MSGSARGERHWRRIAREYAVAIVAVKTAVLIFYALDDVTGRKATVLILTLPAFVAATYGGLGPGLLASAGAAAVTAFFFTAPTWSWQIESPGDRFRVAIIFAIGICASLLGEARARSVRDLRQALERERAARMEAEKLTRARDEFISTVSHELRTPLNAILGWARLLRTSNQALLGRGLEVIERNAVAEAQIVDDLLDASRAWSGKLTVELQPVELRALVAGAVEALGLAAREKDVSIAVDAPERELFVDGDALRLSQVLRNLLDNAIKFSERGGAIAVRVTTDGARATIEVADRGAGIPSDVLGRLFEKFQQADASTTRRHAGLGLGLYLARSIADAHHGAITAESAGPGQGATFRLVLPARPSFAASSSEPSRASTAGVDGTRVLVVDDDADAAEVAERVLREHGARVDVALSAADAVALWEREHHDVVISDLSMPEHDGFWLAREVRRRANGRTPRMVALSALVRDVDRKSAREAGFDGFVAKPFEIHSLLASIAES
ncbi:MAG: ATP-binding protein [Myxococcota bacterium]|nr:ATP-binding protein [Myxococcota bacterium]